LGKKIEEDKKVSTFFLRDDIEEQRASTYKSRDGRSRTRRKKKKTRKETQGDRFRKGKGDSEPRNGKTDGLPQVSSKSPRGRKGAFALRQTKKGGVEGEAERRGPKARGRRKKGKE